MILFIISLLVFKSDNFDLIDFYEYHDSLKNKNKKQS
jgi:hypothetical protein